MMGSIVDAVEKVFDDIFYPSPIKKHRGKPHLRKARVQIASNWTSNPMWLATKYVGCGVSVSAYGKTPFEAYQKVMV